MKNRKKMIAAAAVLGAMALFAGCTTASAVSLEEAKDLVLETMGAENAVVVERETDREDGVYELEIIIDGVSYEFEVDSATGQVREVEREAVPQTTNVLSTEPVAPETPPAETVPVETAPSETVPVETAARITLEEARAIAFAHAGVSEADAYDKSWEQDDGCYEIDFAYGGYDYEYDISLTGQILRSHKEADTDHHQSHQTESHHTSADTTRITADEALAIAMNHAGVTDAYDRDVEWDDGRWEVSFDSGRTEYEYHISADGTILRWEQEHAD